MTVKSTDLLSNRMVIDRNLMNMPNKRIIPWVVKSTVKTWVNSQQLGANSVDKKLVVALVGMFLLKIEDKIRGF